MHKYTTLAGLSVIVLCCAGNAFGEQVQALLVNGCTTPNTYNSTCSVNIPWPAAFLTTNYLVTCTASGVEVNVPSQSNLAPTYDLEAPFNGHTTTNATVLVRSLAPDQPVTVSQLQCTGVLP